MQMPTITERQSRRKLTSEDMAAAAGASSSSSSSSEEGRGPRKTGVARISVPVYIN